MPPDLDLVVIARSGAPALEARAAGLELCELLGRATTEPEASR